MSGVDRAVLTLLGLLLVAAGIFVLLEVADVVAAAQPGSIYQSATETVTARPLLWWTVIILALAVLAGLTLWWALRQLVVRRPGAALDRLVLDRGERGETTVAAVAVAQAVARDLRRIPGVANASARAVGDSQSPSLRAILDADVTADLEVPREQADRVNARARDALDLEVLPMHLRIRPVEEVRSSRVR